jgi:hypothetical protein
MRNAVSKVLVALFACQVASASLAAEIYRWVDDQGRTHLSDVVPEKYKSSATKVESRQFELSESQRKEAAARTAQETEAKRVAAHASAASSPGQARISASAASQPGTSGGSDCDRRWQAYRESQECFAPYLRRDAGPPPEAFERCKQVENPSQLCGPSKW